MVRIGCAQINCTVGDLEGNTKKILEFIELSREKDIDILIFPELAITGYPPEDLLFNPGFIKENIAKLKEITNNVGDCAVLVGFVDSQGKKIYNAVSLIHKYEIKGVYQKMLLPNYGIFDEKRYFQAGNNPLLFEMHGNIFGVNICEDIWHEDGPTKTQVLNGARCILSLNASPYNMGKLKSREDILCSQAQKNGVYIAYVNLVGGQDEIVFDGQSMVINPYGKIMCKAEAFKEDLMITDLETGIEKMPFVTTKNTGLPVIPIKKEVVTNKPVIPERKTKKLEILEEVYSALVLGLKDYVTKNGFKKTVLGLSGGIDSSIVAALAVDALGKDNVTGIFMPTRYSSVESKTDVCSLTEKLGIKLLNFSIEPIYHLYLMLLEPYFGGNKRNVAEENLQARIRANVLMAFSNKFGWLVLSTGNKSEVSTGYATLYGDMAGGLAVIKDVPKTLVYKLAEYRNTIGSVIPENVFVKEPTAELRFNQKDSDVLPPYEVLDDILEGYVEHNRSLEEILLKGYPADVVARVISMVNKSEYKRKQAAPGIKVTTKAFGKERRMPITNKFRG